MELDRAIRTRRMVRSFSDTPVTPDVVDNLVDLARRAPSAGNAQGCRFLVLDTPGDVDRYWARTLDPDRRASFRWQSLVTAPVLIVVAVRPETYVERYAEADKAHTGLGESEGSWPVPYWWVDAGAAIEHILLGAVDAGLGACLFGLFAHEAAVAEEFGVDPRWRLAGTIAIGHRAEDSPGRSSSRERRPLGEVLMRGNWKS